MPAEHPDIAELQAYLDDCDAPGMAALRMHLAECSECRKQLELLDLLQQRAALPGDRDAAPDDDDEQAIMDYVDGKLDADLHAQMEQRLRDDAGALKAALHYASHSQAMSRQPGLMQAKTHDNTRSSARQATEHGPLAALRHWFSDTLSTEVPLWRSVPATAFVTAALAVGMLALWPQLVQHEQLMIAAYQDNPVIQFRSNEALPGIGFFSQAGASSKAYNQVKVNVSEQHADTATISIDWPEVEAATAYNIRLQRFSAGSKREVAELSTSTSSASFTVDAGDGSTRYEWILTGETSDRRTFYTNGGFVLTRPDTGDG